MKVTAQRFRQIALALDGAVEGAHMGHPDFRIDKRIFASLHHDDQFGMVKLTPDQQAAFIDDYPPRSLLKPVRGDEAGARE